MTFARTLISGKTWGTWKVRAMTGPAAAVRRPAGDVFAPPEHLAPRRRLPTRDNVEQGGFPGAVWPDDAQNFPFLERKRYVFEDSPVPIVLA